MLGRWDTTVPHTRKKNKDAKSTEMTLNLICADKAPSMLITRCIQAFPFLSFCLLILVCSERRLTEVMPWSEPSPEGGNTRSVTSQLISAGLRVCTVQHYSTTQGWGGKLYLNSRQLKKLTKLQTFLIEKHKNENFSVLPELTPTLRQPSRN